MYFSSEIKKIDGGVNFIYEIRIKINCVDGKLIKEGKDVYILREQLFKNWGFFKDGYRWYYDDFNNIIDAEKSLIENEEKLKKIGYVKNNQY